MIIVKMMGQLGNQLFIYAMARSLQIQYGDDKIYIDLSSLKRHYYTAQYKLDQYNLPDNIVSYDLNEIETRILKRCNLYSKCFHIEQKIQRILRRNKQTSQTIIHRWLKRGCYFDFNRNWTDFKICDKKVKVVYGYFQSEKYFKSIKRILLNDLLFKAELTAHDKEQLLLIKSSNAVGVSIRMINTFKNVQGFLDTQYYLDGINRILPLLDNPKFFIFADDLEAVKEKITFPVDVTYISPSSSTAGLFLLSSCKNFVIANSTFSWWGAYLASYEGKKIIVPNPWDKDGEYREDIFFDGCIKIPSTFSEEITK